MTETRRRMVLIGCASALMLATVSVVGESMRADRQEAQLTGATGETRSIETETGVFKRMRLALSYKTAPEKEGARTLEQYYQRRAFSGAPPAIPHKDFDPQGGGGRSCNGCHSNGGYVPQLKAYAPVTPHPELTGCKQCHVAGEAKNVVLFASTRFEGLLAAPINQEALPGSPPPIPHTLEMRNNCLACHAGPGAPKEVRTTHPERVNCRQCHVPVEPPPPGRTTLLTGSPTYTTNERVAVKMADRAEFTTVARTAVMEAFPCNRCHTQPLERLVERAAKDKRKAHWQVQLQHSTDAVLTCKSCHGEKDMMELQTLNQKPVGLDHSYQVCGQCHSRQLQDWSAGAHGKRLEGWGPARLAQNCAGCHDPHQPRIQNRYPAQAGRWER